MSDDEHEFWDAPLRRQTVPWANNNVSTRGTIFKKREVQYIQLKRKILKFWELKTIQNKMYQIAFLIYRFLPYVLFVNFDYIFI